MIKDRADSTAKGNQTVPYAENGTGSVATFSVSDPEGASPVVWSLTTEADIDAGVVDADFADNALFDISQSGVLTFKDSPSFEDESAAGDENYQVVVQASDGDEVGYFEVTVTVTDVGETGKVTWTVTPTTGGTPQSLRQFQPGAILMASVTDPDNDSLTEHTWKWYRGSTEVDGVTNMPNQYAVTDSDVGRRIRVTVTYLDGSGRPAVSASFTSENPVQAARLADENSAPLFAATVVTRRIAENSTGNVGGPITATDTNNGDVLTYSIRDSGDESSFAINPATGQLMVGDDTDLDFEADNSYTVEVTAHDSSGTPTTAVAMVTINVFDVDEKPEFGAVAGEANVSADMVAENAPDAELNIATYTATDPELESVTLSLMGDDAGLVRARCR